MGIREKELKEVYNCIKSGESVQILGMSGVGKSNHFNNLLDPEEIKSFFDANQTPPLLIRVNFHYAVDFKPRTVYSLMMEPLESLNRSDEDFKIVPQIIDLHNRLLDVGDDILIHLPRLYAFGVA